MSLYNAIHVNFPIEIYKFMAQRFDGVLGVNFLNVTHSHFEIVFKRHLADNTTIVYQLYEKLANSFKIIKNRYIETDEIHSHIKLRILKDEKTIKIRIHGFTFIPPGKLFELFNLILWYFIKYKTGTKPNNTLYGSQMMQRWKNEEKMTLRELNSNPRLIKMTPYLAPCHKCGELTKTINYWKFYYEKENRILEMQTRVCDKHILLRI